jgi:hypothetical protein
MTVNKHVGPQGALLACNKIVTVSPSYAAEIQNDQRMGCDLADVLKERGVTYGPLTTSYNFVIEDFNAGRTFFCPCEDVGYMGCVW